MSQENAVHSYEAGSGGLCVHCGHFVEHDIHDDKSAAPERDKESGNPIQAHSKSEYKRMSALGANVLPPESGEQVKRYESDDDLARGLACHVIEEVARHIGERDQEWDFDNETEHMRALIFEMRKEAGQYE